MSVTHHQRTVRPSITIPLDPDAGRDDEDRELEELIERVMPQQAVQRKSLYTEPGMILGSGACSVVHRARHLHTRELFAIKTFNVYDKERARQLVRELSTLYRVNCPSLVGFYGVYKNEDAIHVVLEYMDRGSLHDVIHNTHHDTLPEPVIAAITFQILWGLGYLHYEHKLHRDVKPSNILVNSSGEVKLTDFGIARELGEDELAETCIGTFRYMSPERLRGDSYGAAADVWSLGLVLIELATRRTPFLHCNNQIDLNQLLEETNIDRDLVPHGRFSAHFCEFVASCLRPRPDQRLPAAVLLQSPLFAHHGIDDLDMAVEIFKEWLDNNPEDERNMSVASDLHNDATAPCMVSTWKSSDGESSDGEDGCGGSYHGSGSGANSYRGGAAAGHLSHGSYHSHGHGHVHGKCGVSGIGCLGGSYHSGHYSNGGGSSHSHGHSHSHSHHSNGGAGVNGLGSSSHSHHSNGGAGLNAGLGGSSHSHHSNGGAGVGVGLGSSGALPAWEGSAGGIGPGRRQGGSSSLGGSANGFRCGRGSVYTNANGAHGVAGGAGGGARTNGGSGGVAAEAEPKLNILPGGADPWELEGYARSAVSRGGAIEPHGPRDPWAEDCGEGSAAGSAAGSDDGNLAGRYSFGSGDSGPSGGGGGDSGGSRDSGGSGSVGGSGGGGGAEEELEKTEADRSRPLWTKRESDSSGGGCGGSGRREGRPRRDRSPFK